MHSLGANLRPVCIHTEIKGTSFSTHLSPRLLHIFWLTVALFSNYSIQKDGAFFFFFFFHQSSVTEAYPQGKSITDKINKMKQGIDHCPLPLPHELPFHNMPAFASFDSWVFDSLHFSQSF